MNNWVLKSSSIFRRMFRASRLDRTLFREVKIDASASWQAVIVVFLAGLGTGTGIGLGGFFKMAGTLSPVALLIGLFIELFLWLIWSFFAWLIGTKVLQGKRSGTTFRELLRAAGFAVSPGVLGIFVFIPTIGGVILGAVILWVLCALIVALQQVLNFSPGRAIAAWAASCIALPVALIAIVVIWVNSERLFSGNWPFTDSFDSRLNTIVQPFRFSIASWELVNIPAKITKIKISIIIQLFMLISFVCG